MRNIQLNIFKNIFNLFGQLHGKLVFGSDNTVSVFFFINAYYSALGIHFCGSFSKCLSEIEQFLGKLFWNVFNKKLALKSMVANHFAGRTYFTNHFGFLKILLGNISCMMPLLSIMKISTSGTKNYVPCFAPPLLILFLSATGRQLYRTFFRKYVRHSAINTSAGGR